jgi:hypothetical protein
MFGLVIYDKTLARFLGRGKRLSSGNSDFSIRFATPGANYAILS